MMAYQVVSRNPKLKVREYCQAADGLCGAIYLDRLFSVLLRKKLQKYLSGPFCPPDSWVKAYMERVSSELAY
jgi:hypothetical protein